MSQFKIKMRPAVITEIKDVVFKETSDCFHLDIVPEAARNSPVTEAGLERNIELKRKRPGGTGTNRRSLDADVEQTSTGIKAQVYGQSGYSGYLEIGTSRMRPQPYIYPAAIKFLKLLPAKIKNALKRLN